ncbi:MAG: hypothetical protein EON51_15325 [Acinetobacter sp.]|nr:MAG: hypothetical protein EON51_15325 [Acinetobacter sp.]
MKYIKIGIVSLIFIGGILVGFILRNFPLINWNKEIKIYEVFQVCSTLFIGIALPFFVKKWVDDGRVIKTLLVDEAKELISDSKLIKDKFAECYSKKSIDEDEKQHILALFSQVENVLMNYRNNLWCQFGVKIEKDFNILKDSYVLYSNSITSEEFMTEEFLIIDINFLNFHIIEYNKFISSIRTFSVKIQKL